MNRRYIGLFCIVAGLASIMGAGVVIAGGHYPLWIQLGNAILLSVMIIVYGIALATGDEPK